jgi:hypothetical protein
LRVNDLDSRDNTHPCKSLILWDLSAGSPQWTMSATG